MVKRIKYLGSDNKINTTILPDTYETITKIKGIDISITEENSGLLEIALSGSPKNSSYIFLKLNGMQLSHGTSCDFVLVEDKVIFNPLIELFPGDLISIKYFV